MNLNKKWWHRLLKVVFITFIILSLTITFIMAFSSKPENIKNSAYVDVTDQRSISEVVREEGSISPKEFNARQRMKAGNPILEYKQIGSWSQVFRDFIIGILLTFFISIIIRYFYFYIVIGKHKFIFNEKI